MSETPEKFQLYNTQQTKELAVVVEIDGVPGLLSSVTLFETLNYGDPDIFYGDPGLVYGGLVPLTEYNGGEVRNILSLDGSSLTLSQRLEPEQGRASTSLLTLSFIDYQGYMTELCSPGVIVDEILGKNVKVWLGYRQLSFPDDYYVIFRGKISGVTSEPGRTTLQLSDPNLRRRTQVFFTAVTQLQSAITDSDTTIPVISNGDFHKHILGPDGNYDPAIKLYLGIEDEWIEYGPTASLPAGTFGTNTFGNVARGARGSTAVAHDAGTDVTCAIEIEDHAVDIALKVMLSGWNGPYVDDVAIEHIVYTGDVLLGDQATSLTFPENVDVIRDYGWSAGDYLTISGATNGVNNQTVQIVSFAPLFGQENRLVYTTGVTLVSESNTTAVLSVRSQYDTYPISCGVKLTPDDVDVDRHIYIKDTFLQFDGNNYRFFITSDESSAKSWLETQVYLPISCYSLTRFGRLSMGITKPPLADNRLKFLSQDNILNAKSMKPNRGVNNRRFFNEVQFSWDARDDGAFSQVLRTIDSDSLNLIGLASVLPVRALGGRSDLAFDESVERRSERLLSRYKRGATEIDPKVNWEVGVEIEAGDVVALQDDGTLFIANYDTGQRNLGVQLFEVTERSLDIRSGQINLKLVSGVGAQATDRFGTISPSSVLDSGSTSTQLVLTDSYGAIFPGNEQGKWIDYIGQPVLVHNDDWSQSGVSTIIGFDTFNPYLMQIAPPLAFTPSAGYMVEINDYPTSADVYLQQIYKAIHAYIDPRVFVVSGLSVTQFEVSPSDISKFFVGSVVLIHEASWTYESPEVTVTAVDTALNIVTVGATLGFTPTLNDEIELIGFADEGGAYRFI